MIWNQLPTTHGPPADLVLGQSNFTSTTNAMVPSASNFGEPNRMVIVKGRL